MTEDGEIRTLLANVAQVGDMGDERDYVELFTHDAVVTLAANDALGIAESTNRGREEILAAVSERRAAGMTGPGSDTRHTLTTTAVTVEGPARATAQSVFLFFTTASTAPILRSIGMYHDVAVRDQEGWKLARRTVTVG